MGDVNYTLAVKALIYDYKLTNSFAWTGNTRPFKQVVKSCIDNPYNINRCLLWSTATRLIKDAGSDWERSWFQHYELGNYSPQVEKLLNIMLFEGKTPLLSNYM